MQTKTKLKELFGGSQFVHLTHVLPYSNAPRTYIILIIMFDKRFQSIY